jgi:hypothetical protein
VDPDVETGGGGPPVGGIVFITKCLGFWGVLSLDMF